MDGKVQQWLRVAESDLVSAEALHRAGQELHAVFFLQQAVEKTMKALLLKKTAAEPPRIHNLRKLAEICELDLTTAQVELLEDLNGFYLESRYPFSLEGKEGEVLSHQAESLITAAKEFIAWLRSKM